MSFIDLVAMTYDSDPERFIAEFVKYCTDYGVRSGYLLYATTGVPAQSSS